MILWGRSETLHASSFAGTSSRWTRTDRHTHGNTAPILWPRPLTREVKNRDFISACLDWQNRFCYLNCWRLKSNRLICQLWKQVEPNWITVALLSQFWLPFLDTCSKKLRSLDFCLTMPAESGLNAHSFQRKNSMKNVPAPMTGVKSRYLSWEYLSNCHHLMWRTM